MKNLSDVINDGAILSRRFIVRNGFPFCSVTHPANVFDGILVLPTGIRHRWGPHLDFGWSVGDYIKFINEHKLEKAFIISDDISFLDETPTLKHLKILPATRF